MVQQYPFYQKRKQIGEYKCPQSKMVKAKDFVAGSSPNKGINPEELETSKLDDWGSWQRIGPKQ